MKRNKSLERKSAHDMDLNEAAVISFVFMQKALVLSELLYSSHASGDATTRNSDPSKFQQKLNWERLLEKHKHLPSFRRHLRMSVTSFQKLVDFIRTEVDVDESQAGKRGGKIIPELCVYCTLRYLAGGSYTDIHLQTGVSVPSFYRVIWKTMIAINNVEILKPVFPQSPEECAEEAAGFTSRSWSAAIDNCVSAIDGWLLKIQVPPKKVVGNVRSYFSGHYQCYGISVQAACDHHCRFQFLGIGGPGSMYDNDSYKESGLLELVEKLPGYYCAIGDNAYQPSEHCIPVFGGQLATTESNDCFNYYASQLRIRIEMAFGMMIQKWGILQRPLRCSIENVGVLMTSVAVLHNFAINERLLESGEEVNKSYASAIDYEFAAQRNYSAHAEYSEMVSNEMIQHSFNRNRMVQLIKEKQLPGRPTPVQKHI